jgi:CheY-like chemotaxis protein/signal transduction histidine kinase
MSKSRTYRLSLSLPTLFALRALSLHALGSLLQVLAPALLSSNAKRIHLSLPVIYISLRALLLAALSTGWAPHAAAAPAIDIGEHFESLDLTTAVDVLEDPDGTLTPAQLSHPPYTESFKPASSGELQRGKATSAYWLRFAVHNPLSEVRVLTLQSRTRKYATFAIYSSDGNALSEHPIPKFQLMVPAGAQQMYYLRVSPDGTPALQLELRSLDNYLQTYRYKTWFDGVRLSAMTILIGITLAALLFTRDSTYLWLATYGVFIQAYQIVYTPDFGPSIFSIEGRWGAFLPQAMLLLASACSVRLAQVFPVFSGATQKLRPWLYVPLGANLLAIPLLYVAPGLEQVDVTMMLVSATAIIAIAAALYTFLATHQQQLLSYALIRICMVLAVTGGTLVLYSDSSTKPLISSLLPLAMALELFGLLVLLCKCSIDKLRQQTQRDRQIAALEAEGRSRTEMIAEMGHRIRTPVSGVLGMLEMLQDTPLTATQLDYTNTIRRAGNELLNLVNDLADMRNVVVQATELQQTSFDPLALVADCIDGFRGLADAHRLELISDPAPELSVYVNGDPTRLRQIVLQLLHHAVSQHEGGEIVLQVRPAQANWLRFQITVHGQPAQAAVSDMDRRLNPPHTAGVRLAIARQLTDRLGGRLDISEIAANEWSACFLLPLPPTNRQNVVNAEQHLSLRAKQLLLVDDSATFCEVLQRQVSHWGVTVYTAGTASEGLARLRNQSMLGHPIDVLLLDADISEFSDGSWLQRLSEEIAPQPLPVVLMLTSQPQLEDSSYLYQLGVRRVLLKPINHTTLKITLVEELKHRAALPGPIERTSKPVRCLMAEDNIINAKVLAGMLQKLGVEHVVVGNGQEALEACQREQFDIVLMDCDMPVMDGWEATRCIREVCDNRGIATPPIIALTANTLEELGERARQPLMDAHLVKPIHLHELRLLLERWTGTPIVPALEPVV